MALSNETKEKILKEVLKPLFKDTGYTPEWDDVLSIEACIDESSDLSKEIESLRAERDYYRRGLENLATKFTDGDYDLISIKMLINAHLSKYPSPSNTKP